MKLKNTFVSTLVFMMLIITILSCHKPLTTDTEIINNNWTFALGDYQDAQNPDFNDSEWQIIGLPHSFGIPYFMSRDFYTGYGWYRKKINLNADDLEKRILLQFDGVFQEAEVFVNGKLTGSHIGGYTGFVIDITDNAHQGENIVAVRVNNIWKPDVAPRAGEHPRAQFRPRDKIVYRIFAAQLPAGHQLPPGAVHAEPPV